MPPAPRTRTARAKPGKPRSKSTTSPSPAPRPDSPGSEESRSDLRLPYLLNVVANYVNESMREDLSRVGMTVPRWTVLAALREEDGQSIGDLSRHCLIRQSSLTRVVDQLERDGHVERVASKRDHRVVEVWLTTVGEALYERTVPEVVERSSAAIRQLLANEVDQLAEVLGRARESLRTKNPPQENPPKRKQGTPKRRPKNSKRET